MVFQFSGSWDCTFVDSLGKAEGGGGVKVKITHFTSFGMLLKVFPL